jgi:hypothetical protein
MGIHHINRYKKNVTHFYFPIAQKQSNLATLGDLINEKEVVGVKSTVDINAITSCYFLKICCLPLNFATLELEKV